jgi:tetratricopeptide (TPR) repeat protein
VLFRAATAHWSDNLPSSRLALLDVVEQERVEMGNGGPAYLFLVLDLRYLRHYFSPRTPPTVVGAIYDFLLVSESAFFRHLARAIEELTISLLQLIRPNLRLEQPTLAAPLVGRDGVLTACLDDLEKRRSVALSGMSGIGKTSLGTAVRQAWRSDAVFWYTFRPGLNDDLTSLLFSLGHFLHQWGRSSLWLQLTAKGGQLDDLNQAVSFLSDDLSEAGPLLLCFDEVDLLHTATSQPRHGVHKQLLELLEGLREMTSLLLIGQRALIDTNTHYALQPLTVDDIAVLIERQGLDPTVIPADIVHRLTYGNPRLLELYLALLYDTGSDMSLTLGHKPAIRPLFNRLWKRLSQSEKQVLAGLSVFRSHAPADHWGVEPGLEDLRHRQLLKQDHSGGVALLPFFRELVYSELSEERQQQYHRQAAIIRATRGQHTEAAHHFRKAGDIENVVRVWHPYQDVEIAQGKAAAAHAVFNDISGKALRGKLGRQLKVIQNRLHLLHGDAERVLEGMDDYSWHPDEQLSANALQQWSDALYLQGDLDGSVQKLEGAIEVLGRLTSQITQLHVRRSNLMAASQNFGAAEREVILAQYEVEKLRALLGIFRGQYQEARTYWEQALALALTARDEERQAEANRWCSNCAGNLGDLATARRHAEEAMAYYERIGDQLRLEGMRVELAGSLLNLGHFADVIEPAERAMRFFEKIKHDFRLSYIYTYLAEAYFETGNLEKAADFGLRARNSEVIRVQPYAYYTLGQVYQAKDNPEAAELSFQTALKITERTEDQFIAAYLHRVYGKFLMEAGRMDECATELNTAHSLFTGLSMTQEADKTRRLIEEFESVR